MPAQRGGIDQYGVAADLAIVRDMRIGHDQIVIPRLRYASAAACSAAHGAEFAELVRIACLKEPRLFRRRISDPADALPTTQCE